MKKLVAAVATIALAGSLGLASGPAQAAPASGPTIAWGACSDSGLADAGAVCGYLTVPLDYAHPAGTKIQLAVSMIRHTVPAAKYQGIMITNPGGPGGSGLGLSVLGQYVPSGAGDAYDWIGFDPRGVGASIPALTCEPDYFHADRPSYLPTTPALEQIWLTRAANYARACGKHGGALLDHVSTVDSANDMEQIRIALHQGQINYFGFSYGTYLAQVYSTLHPQRVRRMVLDSNVDPRGVWYEANIAQDIAFERNIKIWFSWLAKYDSSYHLGATEKAVEHRFYAESALVGRRPAGGIVGPDEWNDIFLTAGYYQFYWTYLADLFAGWANQHDAGAAAALVAEYRSTDGPGDDNGYAMYTATQCSDVQWPQKWSKWQRDNWATYAKAPFETWSNAWYNAPCLTWPGQAHTPVTVDGSKVKSALLIDETLDAATPYEGSLYVRSVFPGAVLIAEPGGTTHAGSLSGNACVDDKIAAYLATGQLPVRLPGSGPDVRCAPLPQPVPAAASASARVSGAAADRTALVRLLAAARRG